jgi:hypothetical protein
VSDNISSRGLVCITLTTSQRRLLNEFAMAFGVLIITMSSIQGMIVDIIVLVTRTAVTEDQ